MVEATEEMIQAGMAAVREPTLYPMMSDRVARRVAQGAINAALKACKPPPAVSPWLPIDDAARSGDDVLLGCRDNGIQIVAHWDNSRPRFPWRTPDETGWSNDVFDVYRALDPLPPATGDADHG